MISLNINSLNTLEYVIADQCEHKATTQSNRTKHNQSKHLGMKYSCDQCKHGTTTECSLIIHKQSKHLGVKYSCNQCEFKASQRRSLNRHQLLKHLRVKTVVLVGNLKFSIE